MSPEVFCWQLWHQRTSLILLSKCNQVFLCACVSLLRLCFFPMSGTVITLHAWSILWSDIRFSGYSLKTNSLTFPYSQTTVRWREAGNCGCKGSWASQRNNWWVKTKSLSSRSAILIYTRPAVIKGIWHFRGSSSVFCWAEGLCQKNSSPKGSLMMSVGQHSKQLSCHNHNKHSVYKSSLQMNWVIPDKINQCLSRN